MELEKFGVQEMSNDEMKNSDGSWILLLAGAALVSLAWEIAHNPSDCAQGYMDGFNRR